jgi:hypothetical protein
MTQKLIPVALILLFTSNSTFSQDCNLAIKDGSKIMLNAQSFANPLLYDAKFTKAKEDKQEEQIVAFNEGVASGKTPAASNYPMTYTAKKTSLKDGDEYQLTTTISGKEYSSYLVCRDDSLFLSRNRGILSTPDGKGGIYGYSIQGVQRLPLKIKVGDHLSIYEDIIIVLPTTTDMNVKKSVFAGYEDHTTNESGFFTDSRTGESGVGSYTKTTTQAVYKTIDVAVKKTITSSGHIIHYMFAEVTGEENVIVSGVTHKAYIIQSQTWSKQTMTESFESADEEVNQQQKKLAEKATKTFDKMMVKKQSTNELGYMVSYLKEWYVPEIGGMVRTESYDARGGIAGGILLTGLE